jgi:hypothetical protein
MVPHPTGKRVRRLGVMLKPRTLPCGHLWVTLQVDGIRDNYGVHQLVLLAFRGPRPAGMETRHLDGEPTNNTPGNLIWGTHKANMEDRVRHGTSCAGEQNWKARLTSTQVRDARRRSAAGERHVDIARSLGVAPNTISSIVHRHIWRHID